MWIVLIGLLMSSVYSQFLQFKDAMVYSTTLPNGTIVSTEAQKIRLRYSLLDGVSGFTADFVAFPDTISDQFGRKYSTGTKPVTLTVQKLVSSVKLHLELDKTWRNGYEGYLDDYDCSSDSSSVCCALSFNRYRKRYFGLNETTYRNFRVNYVENVETVFVSVQQKHGQLFTVLLDAQNKETIATFEGLKAWISNEQSQILIEAWENEYLVAGPGAVVEGLYVPMNEFCQDERTRNCIGVEKPTYQAWLQELSDVCMRPLGHIFKSSHEGNPWNPLAAFQRSSTRLPRNCVHFPQATNLDSPFPESSFRCPGLSMVTLNVEVIIGKGSLEMRSLFGYLDWMTPRIRIYPRETFATMILQVRNRGPGPADVNFQFDKCCFSDDCSVITAPLMQGFSHLQPNELQRAQFSISLSHMRSQDGYCQFHVFTGGSLLWTKKVEFNANRDYSLPELMENLSNDCDSDQWRINEQTGQHYCAPVCLRDTIEVGTECEPIDCITAYPDRPVFNPSTQYCDYPVSCHGDERLVPELNICEPVLEEITTSMKFPPSSNQSAVDDYDPFVGYEGTNDDGVRDFVPMEEPECNNGAPTPDFATCECFEGWIHSEEEFCNSKRNEKPEENNVYQRQSIMIIMILVFLCVSILTSICLGGFSISLCICRVTPIWPLAMSKLKNIRQLSNRLSLHRPHLSPTSL